MWGRTVVAIDVADGAPDVVRRAVAGWRDGLPAGVDLRMKGSASTISFRLTRHGRARTSMGHMRVRWDVVLALARIADRSPTERGHDRTPFIRDVHER